MAFIIGQRAPVKTARKGWKGEAMSRPIYGNAPPDVIAAFEAERKVSIKADRQRIAAGKDDDIPDELTEEDERILDQA